MFGRHLRSQFFLPLNLSELCAFAVSMPVSFYVQKMAI